MSGEARKEAFVGQKVTYVLEQGGAGRHRRTRTR